MIFLCYQRFAPSSVSSEEYQLRDLFNYVLGGLVTDRTYCISQVKYKQYISQQIVFPIITSNFVFFWLIFFKHLCMLKSQLMSISKGVTVLGVWLNILRICLYFLYVEKFIYCVMLFLIICYINVFYHYSPSRCNV